MSIARVTIADVAKAAGVSIGAVSHAVNGRKGVSDETRGRVISVATELGWAPSSAARSLMEAKTDTVGLAIARGRRALGVDSFFVRFITGVESELAQRSYSLLLQVVPDVEAEMRSHRNWRSSRRVDGLIMVDARVNDPRIGALLKEPSLPAVISGDPGIAQGLAAVWTDDGAAMRESVSYLVALGHRRIARVAGISGFGHTVVRDRAFREQTRKLRVEGIIVTTDYTTDSSTSATRQLLARRPRPTAIVYDNDIMALSGASVATQLGVSVPSELSIIAWDDSAITELTFPPLTAVGHDVVGLGATVARHLFGLIDGDPPGTLKGATPKLIVRASTGRPPADS